MNTLRGYPPVPELSFDDIGQQRLIVQTLNRLNSAKFNATVDVTLTANATSTVITDPRLSSQSFLAWCPLTASASGAERAGIWAAQLSKGSATLNHASAAATDQTLRLLIIG